MWIIEQIFAGCRIKICRRAGTRQKFLTRQAEKSAEKTCVWPSVNRPQEPVCPSSQATESVAFPALFQLLTADETANISRLDIACDDREGFLDMEQIIKKTRSREINSRLRWKDTHESIRDPV